MGWAQVQEHTNRIYAVLQGERHAPCIFFIWIIYLTPLFCFAVAPRGAVLLSWCPNSPCMPRGLHCTCYPLVYSSATQCLCLGFEPVYNRSSANERVPATILSPLQHPGDYLRIQSEVSGQAVIHDTVALHRLEFHIRSPSPSPSVSSKSEPDRAPPGT